MISNLDVARQISELMLDLFHKVDESVTAVNQRCAPEEAHLYEKAAGRVAGAIVMEVLEPLYEKNPALKPPKWDY